MQLIHGDCLDWLPTISDKSVDAIICDPPYGTTACKWDAVIPLDAMWKECKRVIRDRRAIVLFGSQPFTSALIMSNPKWFKYCWIWDKTRGFNPQLANHCPMKSHEDIIVFSRTGHFYNPQKTPLAKADKRNRSNEKANKVDGNGLNIFNSPRIKQTINTDRFPLSIVTFNPTAQTKKIHPSEKPIALLEYLVKTYTNEGDTVLDFTMGSGTTGVACASTGRDFIGIEKDAGYFEIARQRIMDNASLRNDV